MPRVSIIIPVYHVEKYLRQCLESVLNQTLRDIEIICVDDGSTDASAAILREYADKDSRVKELFHEHTNAGAARNAGMAVATGEYLGFVDSDDWCDSTLFEKAYAKAKADDADVVSWRFHQYDERTKKTGTPRVFPPSVVKSETPFTAEVLGDGIFVPITYAPWGRIVRRTFVMAEDLRFQEIVRTNDVYFCCLVRALAPRQTIVDEVLYTYRVGTGTNLQANNAASPASAFEAWKAVAEALGRRGLRDHMRKALISASANSFFYTLNTMSAASSWCDFHERLRKLYGMDAFYSSINVDEIDNPQTAAYFRILKETDAPLEFLVRQENYYRERLAMEYWTRIGSQKFNRELQECEVRMRKELAEQTMRIDALGDEKARLAADVECLKDEKTKSEAVIGRLMAEKELIENARDELQKDNVELSKRVAEQIEINAALQNRIAQERIDKETLKRSLSYRIGRAVTWLPRYILGSFRR